MSQSVSLAPVTERPRFRLRFHLTPSVQRALSPLLIVAVWQIASATGILPADKLAAPSSILESAWDLALHGNLAHHLGISLLRVLAGFGLGAVLGTALALFAGLSRVGENIFDAPLQMLRTLPHLALVPLFILWFGIGETPKLLLVTLGAMFPIYLNLFGAIRGVDKKLIEMARISGLSQRGIVTQVILPSALPSALIGIRYALGVAWLSLVVAEQINADAGIGYLINDARDFLRTDIIVVGLLIYALLGLGADALVRLVERRALSWRPTILGA